MYCGYVTVFRYCECFANGEFCYNCNCNNCFNNLDHEDDRSRAIKSCLDRNPNAFRPKIGACLRACVVVATTSWLPSLVAGVGIAGYFCTEFVLKFHKTVHVLPVLFSSTNHKPVDSFCVALYSRWFGGDLTYNVCA